MQPPTQKNNFWLQLEKPIVALSPMDGVTDQPCRHIQKKYGQSAVIYTEFASVEGLCHGAARLLKDFVYDETQRPIVAQIYGTTPEFFRQVAVMVCELGFDGIDINMGCPAKNVAHSGAGAALIKTPMLAQEIVRATYEGIQDYLNGKNTKDCSDIVPEIAIMVKHKHASLPEKYQERRALPISVKTRIGYSEPVIESWIPTLLEVEPSVIALHGRTLNQHYSGLADWDQIAKAAEIIHQTPTIVLGNGDTQDYQHALNRFHQYSVDGVLLGRSTFGNPGVLLKEDQNAENIQSRFAIALEHAYLFERTYQSDERYNFLPMRKHLGWYVKGVVDATEIRKKVFAANTAQEIEEIFKLYNVLTDDEVSKIKQLGYNTKIETWSHSSVG